jgi:hypothetical protein
MFVLKALSILDVVFVCLKIVCFIGRKYRLSSGCFLSHRRWFWLDLDLYWRQKFRSAASWENDGIGKAGNIIKQANKLPGVG